MGVSNVDKMCTKLLFGVTVRRAKLNRPRTPTQIVYQTTGQQKRGKTARRVHAKPLYVNVVTRFC